MTAVYPYADYITVNISSPNTPGLRNLQFGDNLQRLLEGLKITQKRLAETHRAYKPMLVKIAPDMDTQQLRAVSAALLNHGIDGVIATNTTLDHSAVQTSPLARQAGGLSGAPLTARATQVVAQLRSLSGRFAHYWRGGDYARR